MLELVMPPTVTVVVDVVAWGFFHSATGYAAHRLGDRRLSREGWWLRPRSIETADRYRRWLRINAWKDKVPEAGALFSGGVSKRQLPSYDAAGLELFVRETRRAELGHGWAMACSPLFVLWNPPLAAGVLVAYGVVVNLPFILIQRYNRIRTQALLARLVR